MDQITKLFSENSEIVIVHVADTYFIEETRVYDKIDLPGFARFNSLLHSIKSHPLIQENKTPVIIFHGGDFLFPSLMSANFEGKQMIDVMNSCKFDYCTLGNHDFEQGNMILYSRMSEANFDIICCNIKDSRNDNIKIKDYVIYNDKDNLPFAAIIGIAGKATLEKASQNDFETSSVESALKEIIETIKKNHTTVSHLIILSHMSNREDVKLQEWVKSNWNGFIYILGGHDHNNLLNYNENCPKSILVKGESNCRTVQIIGLKKEEESIDKNHLLQNIVIMNSDQLSEFDPDSQLQEKVSRWEKKLKKILDEPDSDRIIKKFPQGTILDATELQLRKGSTNFGNFIVDCMQNFAASDIAFINSGHFRGDRKIGSEMRKSNVRRIFVLDKKDLLVKIPISKKECIDFLKHAFSEEGRGKILQISKDTQKILEKSRDEDNLSLVTLWDMIRTNDDGFTTILAGSRKKSVEEITTEIENQIIPNSSIFDILEKSSDVEYDPTTRISVASFDKFLTNIETNSR